MITCKKLMTKKLLIGAVLGAMLSATIITGCAVDSGIETGGDSEHATVSREISERGGNEARGEHGGSSDSGGEIGSEGGNENSGGETNEAAMSSPVIPLDRSWNGTLGGLAVAMQYDAATKSVHGTVQNATSQQLCYVQAEPHLKSGAMTIGELGPDRLGDLNPGQEVTSRLSVASEPSLAGVSYDGYVVHMEVYDCTGTGPVPHTGGERSEAGGGESRGEHGGGESGSEHGSGGENSGGESGREGRESGDGGEEGSGASTLALDEAFDEVRGGARLILNYDAPSNSFKGTVENTTGSVLKRVRIEVHLSNGTELGPTTPIDMPPGAVAVVNMPATQASFTGWIAHAEVGGGESGGEHGDMESGSEHGSGRESGSEHGDRGERRGGG